MAGGRPAPLPRGERADAVRRVTGRSLRAEERQGLVAGEADQLCSGGREGSALIRDPTIRVNDPEPVPTVRRTTYGLV